MRHDIETFLTLERAVWQALVQGDASADGRLLEEGFLGVYATGFSDKSGHVGQLAAGPTVAEFTLRDARLLVLGPGVVLLAYRAEYTRTGGGPLEEMYVSSVWRAGAQGWRNIFSQDTALGDCAPV